MSRRPDERSQPVYQQRGSDIASARRERGSSVSSWSIRTRLLISIGAMLVTIIAAMIWVGYREVSVSASDLARERLRNLTQQIGRASCRERVEISEVEGCLKKTKKASKESNERG